LGLIYGKEEICVRGITIKYKSLTVEVSAFALATLLAVVARALGLL
jgi:hypothetical protein